MLKVSLCGNKKPRKIQYCMRRFCVVKICNDSLLRLETQFRFPEGLSRYFKRCTIHCALQFILYLNTIQHDLKLNVIEDLPGAITFS